MFIAFDLFRSSGTMTIYMRKNKRILKAGEHIPCHAPWDHMNLDNSDEELLFECTIKRILSSLSEEYKEDIDFAIFVIPHEFSYIKRSKIKQIVSKVGAQNVRCGYGIEYEAYMIYPHVSGINFYLQINHTDVEIGVVDVREDVIEVLGVNHIVNNYETNSEQFYKQLQWEVKQLLRDIDRPWEHIGKLIVYGNYSKSIITFLEQYSGKSATVLQNLAIDGALKLIYEMLESDYKYILLQTIPYDLSVSIDYSEERKTVFQRYHNVCALWIVQLSVSPGTTLNLYEGNFPNLKFNTCLCSIQLDNITREQIIECKIEIDAEANIKLTIFGSNNELLFEKGF